MFGIVFYTAFILTGIYMSFVVFDKFKLYEQFSIGLAIGFILGAWLPAVVSLIYGKFNMLSNLIALILLVLIVILVTLYNNRKKHLSAISVISKIDLQNTLRITAVILPLMIIVYIIFYGHVLLEVDGHLFGGQSTYGDLAMHLGMITSIAKQGVFPPEYSILPGTRLSYPFLVNSQSASLHLFGTSLRLSVIYPSLVMSLSCFLGLYALAKSFVKKHGTATLVVLMFFITGGLGFFYYLDDTAFFKSIFTGYYVTPTNYPDLNISWVNVICDMLVPQRTFLMGLSILIPVLLLLKKSLEDNDNRQMLFAGIMASSMPLIHTHSFLALGILCTGLLFFGYVMTNNTVKQWTFKWLYFLAPVIVFATPQLIFWIFTQTGGFVRYHLDWVNNGREPWLWFWIKNIGIPFVLIIPALIWGFKKHKLWYLSATLIFLISEFIVFQPNQYDNNKLMLVWYIFTCILVADYLTMLWHKLSTASGKYYIAAIGAILLFTSGALTIAREINSNSQYMQYSETQVTIAEAVVENTPADVLFVTGTQHLNEISALAGRNIYAGSTLYLHFHGLDYGARHNNINDIYSDIELSAQLLEEIQADYIYISSYEIHDYIIDYQLFELYDVVLQEGEVTILAVSDIAKEIGKFK